MLLSNLMKVYADNMKQHQLSVESLDDLKMNKKEFEIDFGKITKESSLSKLDLKNTSFSNLKNFESDGVDWFKKSNKTN